MARKPRPTLQEITQSVMAIGGTMTSLAYQLPVMGVTGGGGSAAMGAADATGENGVPYILDPTMTSGQWSNFYGFICADLRYHLLQFEGDVRGDANNAQFPQNWIVRLPPTGPNKVKMYLDQIFTGDPSIEVQFPTLKGEKRHEMEKQWSAYLMQALQGEEKDSDFAPLDTQKLHCCAYGLGVRYDVLDMTRWPDRPKKRQGESMDEFDERMKWFESERRSTDPFAVKTIHPLNTAYDRTSKPPQWAMIREPLMPWEAAARYPHWAKLTDAKEMPVPGVSPVVKVEWWTPDWVGIYINGQPALGPKEKADSDGVAPNRYGLIPLTFAAGGCGENDVANRPDVELAGILRKIKPMLLTDATIFNLEEIYRRAASFGPKKVLRVGNDDVDGAEADEVALQLGAGPTTVARIKTGWEITTINPPPMPPEIADQRARVKDEIDQATAYNVAAGAPQGGPAYKMQLQLQQVSKRVGLDVLHLQQSMERWGENRLRMLKRMLPDEKVGARIMEDEEAKWTDLEPNALPDQIQVTVKLTTDSAEEKARKEQAGLALWNNGQGIIGRTTFLKDYMDEPDAERIEAEKTADDLYDTVTVPFLQQVAQQGIVGIAMEIAQQKGIQAAQPALQEQDAARAEQGAVAAGASQPALTAGPQGAVLPGEPVQPGLTGTNPMEPMQAGNGAMPFPRVMG